MNYTAYDFANARFAEHSDGTYGARTHPHMSMWSIYDKKRQMVNSYTDADMARFSFRPVRESAPLTLDTLREAWENAEVPTECNPTRQGDVYISHMEPNDRGLGFYVAAAGSSGTHLGFNHRIRHRAPQPEPWQDLADGIEAFGWEIDSDNPKALAKYLHSKGVRVTGGDES